MASCGSAIPLKRWHL